MSRSGCRAKQQVLAQRCFLIVFGRLEGNDHFAEIFRLQPFTKGFAQIDNPAGQGWMVRRIDDGAHPQIDNVVGNEQ